jgi:signal transduction histidine kinase
MEDQEQLFAVSVLEALMVQSSKAGRQWARHSKLAAVCASRLGVDQSGQVSDPTPDESHDAGHLVEVLIAAAVQDPAEYDPLTRIGVVIGAEAHQQNVSLHVMLEELDLLSSILLHSAEEVVSHLGLDGSAPNGLAIARRIVDASSRLRRTAVFAYTQATADELRERFRAIRHDLRNPLGTIKGAVALLTDESISADMSESRRVQAMVVRNARSLDQLIGKVLGDAAAQLQAFEISSEKQSSTNKAPASGREQRNDLTRTRERPDFESGTP